MKTIDQIRRDNLQALVDEYGSAAAVVSAIGCSASQFSQWLNASQNSGTGKPRGIATASCRRIEKATNKPVGWMDKEHPAGQAGAQLAVITPPERETRMILAYDDEIALLDLYRRSDERGKREIFNSGRIEADRTSAEVASHKR
jgi:hypothetical protein